MIAETDVAFPTLSISSLRCVQLSRVVCSRLHPRRQVTPSAPVSALLASVHTTRQPLSQLTYRHSHTPDRTLSLGDVCSPLSIRLSSVKHGESPVPLTSCFLDRVVSSRLLLLYRDPSCHPPPSGSTPLMLFLAGDRLIAVGPLHYPTNSKGLHAPMAGSSPQN